MRYLSILSALANGSNDIYIVPGYSMARQYEYAWYRQYSNWKSSRILHVTLQWI